MITLHYLTDSRAQRILWMLEEVGVEYELKVHRRQSNQLAPPSLRAVHPLGKAPVLEDGELTLAESAHIVEHLAERHAPALLPEDPELARELRYWQHFAEGSFAPPLIMKFFFTTAESRVPALLRPLLMAVPRLIGKAYLDATLATLMTFVDDHLAQREFFVGEGLTGADVMMLFPCEAVVGVPANRERYRNIAAYVARMQGRPAYARALERSGVPYKWG